VTGREGRIANVAGALLVGGESARIASATRAARLLDSLFEEVLLVGGELPADAPGRRVPDPDGPRCALRGLVGALDAARAERVLVVATDLPRLTAELLLALVAWPEAAVVAPRAAGRLELLCAIYARDAVLPRARERLASGRLALHELVGELELFALDGDDLRAVDPEGSALANATKPEERSRLEAKLHRKG
jgi:molybdopterin-guanine dinucleotide biosynthesis protein A